MMKKFSISLHYFKSLLVFLVTICSLQNCAKDPCKGIDPYPPDEYHNVPEQDLSKIPYTGFDTLVYVSDSGDTAALYGHGRFEYHDEIKASKAIHCYSSYSRLYQHLEYSFAGNDSLNTVLYNVYMNDYDETGLYFRLNKLGVGGSTLFYNLDSQYNSSIVLNGKNIPARWVAKSYVEFYYNYRYGFLQIKFIPGKTWKLRLQ